MTEKQIRNALYLFIENHPKSIKAYVAKEALKQKSLASFFRVLRQRGCISGMVYSLNHYPQTHEFFESYYEEIECFRLKYLKSATEIVYEAQYDLKTALVWFAFEQAACELVHEFKIEEGVQ